MDDKVLHPSSITYTLGYQYPMSVYMMQQTQAQSLVPVQRRDFPYH